MADWDDLRDLSVQVAPPPFADLEQAARLRDRRARAMAVAAAGVVAVGVGLSVLVVTDDRGTVEPAGPPRGVVDDVRALPEAPSGRQLGPLEAGRYRVPLDDALSYDIELPQGTRPREGGLYFEIGREVLKAELAGREYGAQVDPCRGPHDVIPLGPGVDDVVDTIRRQPGLETGRPAPVRVGGAAGIRIEVRIPETYDASRCVDRQVGLPGNPGTTSNMPPGYAAPWWVLDVGGRRVVLHHLCDPCTPEGTAQVEKAVGSIAFTPSP